MNAYKATKWASKQTVSDRREWGTEKKKKQEMEKCSVFAVKKWDFHHLFERCASDKCISCSAVMISLPLPSVWSIVPSHMSRSITTRCWAPAGSETQTPGAFYSSGFMLIRRKAVKKNMLSMWKSCIMSCWEENKKQTFYVGKSYNTYFSSWELAAISDLSVLSARGHPDTLERIKS